MGGGGRVGGHHHLPVLTERAVLHIHVVALVQVRGAAFPAARPTALTRTCSSREQGQVNILPWSRAAKAFIIFFNHMINQVGNI